MSDHNKVTPSSGNIFADIGLPNSEEHLAKATIAVVIGELIKERGLSQEGAGKILGLSQPNISNLVRGKLEKFSLDRLMRYMRKLDYDVVISLKPKIDARKAASLSVESPSLSA